MAAQAQTGYGGPSILSRSGGFQGIANEWWHFDLLDRKHVREHFTRVE